MDISFLIKQAQWARTNAYAPYSNFCVGAALLTKDEKIFTGCNIENASYSGTNCAERTAIFKAISEGATDFTAIAIVGGSKGPIRNFCPPCGICRQIMAEFCSPKNFQIILATDETNYKIFTLQELLPMGFGCENLV